MNLKLSPRTLPLSNQTNSKFVKPPIFELISYIHIQIKANKAIVNAMTENQANPQADAQSKPIPKSSEIQYTYMKPQIIDNIAPAFGTKLSKSMS